MKNNKNIQIGDIVKFSTNDVKKKGTGIVIDILPSSLSPILVKLQGALKGTGHSCCGKFDTNDYWYVDFSEILEIVTSVNSYQILVTTDGKNTYAVMQDGRNTRQAVAKRNPKDDFDFETGAKIALKRLFFSPHLTFKGKNMGNIGDKTDLYDSHGNPLFVGDVVHLFGINEGKETYFGRKFVVKENGRSYIMYSRGCSLDAEWETYKCKSFIDLEDGEQIGDTTAILTARITEGEEEK